MKRGYIIFMVLFSVFLAIGCTGSNSGKPANSSETPATTPSEASAVTPGSNTTPQPAGEGKIVEVSIQGFAFNPQTVEISAGDTVKWTNMDSATHDVKGTNFDSGTLAKGGT
jgi:plastocyanin